MRRFIRPLTAGILLTTVMAFTGTAHADSPPQSVVTHPSAVVGHTNLDLFNSPHCSSDVGPLFAPAPIASVVHNPDNDNGGWLCSDSQFYRRGQVVTFCYDVPGEGTFVDLALQYPSGSNIELTRGFDDGTGDCFQARSSYQTGWRTLRLYFDGQEVDELRYFVGR